MSADHDRDTETGTLFTSTSIQWRAAIKATVAVSRFRRSLTKNPRQQGDVPLEQEFETQHESPHENGNGAVHEDTHGLSFHEEEANLAPPLALENLENLERELEGHDPEVEVLKMIRDDLVKQLDAYGIVLVLLAGITFVAILQPPGSVDGSGKLRPSVLVSFFMLLATLSFFISCTGLLAVMVGCAQLFRPFFYTKLAKYTNVVSERFQGAEAEAEAEPSTARPRLLTCALGICKLGSPHVAVESPAVLAKLCEDNVYRIWRIRVYLGVALVTCLAAYICGALAVMLHNVLQRYLLVGAMGAGVVIGVFEICMDVIVSLESATNRRGGSFQENVGRLTPTRRHQSPERSQSSNSTKSSKSKSSCV